MQLNEEHLIDIKFSKKCSQEIIKLFICGAKLIEIGDCIKVNNIATEIMNNEGFLDYQTLEISSPVIFMKLNKPEHFKIFKGKRIKVKLLKKIQGYNITTGNIVKYSKKGISLKRGDKIENLNIPFSCIYKANLEPEIKI